MKQSKHNRHVQVMTKLHEIEVLRQVRIGVRGMINDVTEDFQMSRAYNPSLRDDISQQLTALYALHDALGQKIKQSEYIWN